MTAAQQVVEEVFGLYRQYGTDDYIGEPVSQIEHMSQAAELAMARNQPKAALTALNHPSLQNLKDLPPEQQIRTASVHARAYEADGQTLAAARERVAMAPLLVLFAIFQRSIVSSISLTGFK